MPETGTVCFRFTGQAGEYFRIWIVNICLSIVTLGIYSAWAKVRGKRYFYGNALLNDSAFEYLADPKVILKGRVIVFVAFVAYSLIKQFYPLMGLALILAMLAILPWVVIRAMRFNARNSAHRNVRFGFGSSYGEMLALLAIPALLVPFTLGLAYPYYIYRKKKLVIERSSYGNQPFRFHATIREFYLVFLKVFLVGVGVIVGSVVTLGIALLPLAYLGRAYEEASVARLTWFNTSVGDIRFGCDWRTLGLFKLGIVNILAIIASVGLLIPWASIRTARYKLEHISLQPIGKLGDFLAATQEDVSATGDEAGELLGFDFGL
jgi:uncharacterized membrane protein YjgN (DUF898 family)